MVVVRCQQERIVQPSVLQVQSTAVYLQRKLPEGEELEGIS